MRRAQTTVLIAVAIVCIVYSACELVAMRFATSTGQQKWLGLATATRLSPINWHYPEQSALLLRALGRLEDARARTVDAIAQYPACGTCWAQLAEIQAALGENPREALEQAVQHGRAAADIRTRAAVVYMQLGDYDRAIAEFRASLLGVREDRDDTFRLLHQILPKEVVLEDIVTDENLGPYFAFVRGNEAPEFIDRVWERYADLGADAVQRKEFVADLLRSGRVQRGWQVAFATTDTPAALVLNGDFQDDRDYGRFGWRIANGEGVKARVRRCPDCETEERSLHIAFDGRGNTHYYGTSQIAPTLGSSHYALRARVRYDGISSARGPQFVVTGMAAESETSDAPCRFRAAGEEFHGTSAWRDTEVFFTVPATCEGVRIFVARPRTRHLDRYIEGDLWVDDVRLELLGRASEDATQPTPASFFPPAG